MNKIKNLLSSVIIAANITSLSAFATTTIKDKAPESVKQRKENGSKEEYQKIIDEYKKYLQTIPKEVREEIKNFRVEMIRLNNEKRSLYKKLTNQSQEFLKKEREYKKKLPIKMRKELYEEVESENTKDKTVN